MKYEDCLDAGTCKNFEDAKCYCCGRNTRITDNYMEKEEINKPSDEKIKLCIKELKLNQDQQDKLVAAIDEFIMVSFIQKEA